MLVYPDTLFKEFHTYQAECDHRSGQIFGALPPIQQNITEGTYAPVSDPGSLGRYD